MKIIKNSIDIKTTINHSTASHRKRLEAKAKQTTVIGLNFIFAFVLNKIYICHGEL